MRAADHQVQMPMVVSTVSKDARYKADETDLGFKPVKRFSAEEASAPAQASCVMKRPG
jgi:branched-chain amino acid transport system substrate-binding protein